MSGVDPPEPRSVLEKLRAQAEAENLRFTQHAQKEMAEEGVSVDEVLEAIASGEIVENYPSHRRGACCLLNGRTRSGRFLHTVCTTARPCLIIVTVYEPAPPKWPTPTRRGIAR